MHPPIRILYFGNVQGLFGHQKFYLIPQRLVNGFTRCGHMVYALNDRDFARYANPFRSRAFGARKVDGKLLAVCRDYRPDLVVLSNCEMVSNEAVHALREILPEVRVAYRNVDSLNMSGNRKKVERRLGVVDTIFLTSSVTGLQDPSGRTKLAFMPNPIDPSLDRGRAFEIARPRYDLFFAGQAIRDQTDSRPAILGRLQRELGDLRLGFFGSAVGRSSLYGQDYLDALADSAMGLSLDREDENPLYASDRMSHYLGNGLLTFVKRGKGFERFFTDREVAWFNGADDVIETVRRLATDSKQRQQIAEAGWRRARELFDCARIAAWIVELSLDRPFSQKYPWVDG
ncbi:glycosyltransferase family protein [Algihabitans albus]|uniref:glycosyltransferase family protein n=1 Tax=Algihabitans albus TaxID=2164067 RepID=UPI000E5CEB0C|nr:glycosyltransferase [Algihabitans albus]